jgi:hypothetical protein
MPAPLIMPRTVKAAALGLVLSFAAGPGHAELFSHLAGSWAGNGTISFNSGTRERIRCRAQYAPGDGGATVRLELRCASDSYKFELQSNLVANGTSISGTWGESTRNVFGIVTGNGTSGRIDVVARSPTFSAFLRVSTRGNRQNVSIQSPGSEMAEVAISLARSSRR